MKKRERNLQCDGKVNENYNKNNRVGCVLMSHHIPVRSIHIATDLTTSSNAALTFH